MIAHRGFSGLAPENTLDAFHRAVDAGCDMIELDVQLSSDGAVVVFHDDDLDRTTDGAGPLATRTWEELRRLDAGAWFGSHFAGARIPSLSEALQAVATELFVNVEVKSEAVTEQIVGGVVDLAIRDIKAAGAAERVVLSSFEPRALEQARMLDPKIRRSQLFDPGVHRGRSPAEVLRDAEACVLSLARDQVTFPIVEQIHDAGSLVFVYTVNEAADMHRILELGVDGLFTDRPDRMLELLAKEGPWT